MPLGYIYMRYIKFLVFSTRSTESGLRVSVYICVFGGAYIYNIVFHKSDNVQ